MPSAAAADVRSVTRMAGRGADHRRALPGDGVGAGAAIRGRSSVSRHPNSPVGWMHAAAGRCSPGRGSRRGTGRPVAEGVPMSEPDLMQIAPQWVRDGRPMNEAEWLAGPHLYWML